MLESFILSIAITLTFELIMYGLLQVCVLVYPEGKDPIVVKATFFIYYTIFLVVSCIISEHALVFLVGSIFTIKCNFRRKYGNLYDQFYRNR